MRVEINKLGINGEGVARATVSPYENKVCFVTEGLPGEILEIEITKDKKNYCYGEIREIFKSSPNRIHPICPFYGKCGGCDLQHMDKSLQIEFKQDRIKETLSKSLDKNISVEKLVRLNDFGYRNKMVFPIGNSNGHAMLGMFKHNTHNVVAIDRCLLTSNLINKVLDVSNNYFSKSNFMGYDFINKIGDIKYLVVRNVEDDILVTIVSKIRVDLTEYFKVLKSNFQNVGLSNIVSSSEDDILSGKYYHIDGLKQLEFNECGVRYLIDNRGFLQVNTEVKDVLYNLVLDEIEDNEVVIDAYSGAGLLSAIISKKSKFVTGIEINESASNSAKKMAEDNKINNIKFINGDVKDYIENLISENDKITIVLDPPRSGCDNKVTQAIISKSDNISKIIYVSCNPATLTRDIAILKDCFNVTKIIPLDMFPQTKHVETLVVLKK